MKHATRLDRTAKPAGSHFGEPTALAAGFGRRAFLFPGPEASAFGSGIRAASSSSPDSDRGWRGRQVFWYELKNGMTGNTDSRIGAAQRQEACGPDTAASCACGTPIQESVPPTKIYHFSLGPSPGFRFTPTPATQLVCGCRPYPGCCVVSECCSSLIVERPPCQIRPAMNSTQCLRTIRPARRIGFSPKRFLRGCCFPQWHQTICFEE